MGVFRKEVIDTMKKSSDRIKGRTMLTHKEERDQLVDMVTEKNRTIHNLEIECNRLRSIIDSRNNIIARLQLENAVK